MTRVLTSWISNSKKSWCAAEIAALHTYASPPLLETPRKRTPPISAIITDLDMTLWVDTRQPGVPPFIPDSTINLLKSLKIPVYVATGRTAQQAKFGIRSAKLDKLINLRPGIYEDGHYLLSPSKAHRVRGMKREVAISLRDRLVSRSVEKGHHVCLYFQTSQLNGLNHESNGSRWPGILSRELRDMETVYDNFDSPDSVNEITIFGSTSALAFVDAQYTSSRFARNRSFHYVIVSPLQRIIRPAVSKSTGVRWLCKKLKLSADEVLVIGDYLNDYEMLRDYKNSVAMGTAPEVVRKVAAHVTDDCSRGGWATAVTNVTKRKWKAKDKESDQALV